MPVPIMKVPDSQKNTNTIGKASLLDASHVNINLSQSTPQKQIPLALSVQGVIAQNQ